VPRRAWLGSGEGRPQHHDIDALVGDTVMTQRTGNLAGGVLRAPWPVPGANALLHVGDNLVGDAAVNVTDFGHGPFSFGLGFAAAAATLPVGETGGSKGKGDGRGGGSPARRAASCGSAQAQSGRPGTPGRRRAI